MTSLDCLTDDQVADEITTWAGRIAAGEARLLELIAEFDRREAWAGVGVLSCAHWLSWRLGMGLKAAHERVRVARALTGLPATKATFMAGGLSWTQVRAVTRVATPSDEQTYVELARHATGAQLERLVRGVRRAQKIVEDEADPELAAHRMRARLHYDVDGSLVLSMRLPAEQGAVFLAAVEQARAELDRQAESSAEDVPPQGEAPAPRPAPASVADAVLHLARRSLGSAEPELARRNRARLVAHVDPLTGWGRLPDGELLPPAVLTEDLGRTTRVPSLALRELLGAVDGERCRFPSCTRRRRLHAHHVEFWSAGGSTDLANLILLCSRHHTLVHRHGFRLSLRPDRRLAVSTADGRSMLHHPALPWQPRPGLDPDQSVTPTTLPPVVRGYRLDLSYAVAVLRQQAA
ncbi:MAG: DUF222 domain-containing protein [Actinomycetota bacterium]|nr:DUF222 domain-containing protein [Actinomycetota bacterium]